ncbi:MAG: flagellar basal body L-ring protein FlgH [Pseudomonadota bacterium]|nr:flagellar basal body L-ring protein FlgH [Pseudomonadota bacterium]
MTTMPRTPLLTGCVAALLAGLLAACADVPPRSIVDQPMSALPPRAPADLEPTGGIFRAQPGVAYRPLFEDRRAQQVGDTLIVSISENTSASKKSSTDASRDSSSSLSISPFSKLPSLGLGGASLTGTQSSKFAGAGDAAATNAFTGTITVTVVDVLSNGNLVVRGEKQVAVNQGTEYVRLSGVVAPANIVGGNTVSSTQIADAKIEYKANGFIDEAQKMGWLQRFFLNVSPF